MSETKTDMMLNGICMVCEKKDTLCTHIGQVKEECPFIQKAISTKITNAMRIRSMTDEELAEFLCEISMCKPDYCPAYLECMKTEYGTMTTWLKSEAE